MNENTTNEETLELNEAKENSTEAVLEEASEDNAASDKNSKEIKLLLQWLEKFGFSEEIATKLIQENNISIKPNKPNSNLYVERFSDASHLLSFLEKDNFGNILEEYLLPFDKKNLQVLDNAYCGLGDICKSYKDFDAFKKKNLEAVAKKILQNKKEKKRVYELNNKNHSSHEENWGKVFEELIQSLRSSVKPSLPLTCLDKSTPPFKMIEGKKVYADLFTYHSLHSHQRMKAKASHEKTENLIAQNFCQTNFEEKDSEVDIFAFTHNFPRVATKNALAGKTPKCLGENAISPENKNLFIVLSPIDKLFFNALGEYNVLVIPLETFSYFGENQSLSFYQTISKLTSGNKNNYFEQSEEKRYFFQRFYLAFPYFELKEEFEQDLGERLGINKTLKLNLKAFLQEGISEYQFNSFFEATNLINFLNLPEWKNKKLQPSNMIFLLNKTAKSFPISGVHSFDDVEKQIDETVNSGLEVGQLVGYSNLNHFFKLKMRQITAIQGITHMGKSVFCKNLLINISSLYGYKAALYLSEEKNPADFFRSMIEIYTDKLTPTKTEVLLDRRKESDHLDKNSQTYEQAKSFVREHFKLVSPNFSSIQDESANPLENNKLTLLLEEFKQQIMLFNTKIFVIDSWNKIVNINLSTLRDDEFLSYQLDRLKEFAEEYNVHVFITINPKTPKINPKTEDYYIPRINDPVGGILFAQKANTFISLHRKLNTKLEGISNILEVYIQRVSDRTVGKIGFTFLASFNTEKLFDCIDENLYIENLRSFYGLKNTDFSLNDILKKGFSKNKALFENINNGNNQFIESIFSKEEANSLDSLFDDDVL